MESLEVEKTEYLQQICERYRQLYAGLFTTCWSTWDIQTRY